MDDLVTMTKDLVKSDSSPCEKWMANIKSQYDPRTIKEFFMSGLSKGKCPSDFDQDALSKGIAVEQEHTESPAFATKVAMDHLVENPNYYDQLEKAGL
jgi:hypothetical protein